MILLQSLRRELKKIANPKKAKVLQRFFKTGKGEYGEGDKFLGITVPASRKIAVKYKNLDFASIGRLLHSKIHEERLIALLILVCKFDQTNILPPSPKASEGQGESVGMNERIFNFYLKNTKYINNWDLVDLSAPKIVGEYLFDFCDSIRSLDDFSVPSGNTRSSDENKSLKSAKKFCRNGSGKTMKSSSREKSRLSDILLNLVKSKNVWEKRIAVLATFYFIKNNQFDETLKIAEMLLQDQHDLIQKAVGWMLREVGKRDLNAELGFLKRHCKQMPRTMLRYAIERFPKNLKIAYLQGKT